MLTITLPYPISANRYWRSRVVKGVAITYVSAEAKAYKQEVMWLLRAAGVRSPLQGRVNIHFDLYPKRPQDWQARMRKFGANWDDTVQCIDCDNARKVLYDSLKGVAIVDDKWVWKESGERREPDGEARLVVTITPIGTAPVQAPQTPRAMPMQPALAFDDPLGL